MTKKQRVTIDSGGRVRGVPDVWAEDGYILIKEKKCPIHGDVNTLVIFNQAGFDATEICFECIKEIIAQTRKKQQ